MPTVFFLYAKIYMLTSFNFLQMLRSTPGNPLRVRPVVEVLREERQLQISGKIPRQAGRKTQVGANYVHGPNTGHSKSGLILCVLS